MGLTNLRHHGAPATPPAPAPARRPVAQSSAEASGATSPLDLRLLHGWFEQFAALHHVTLAAVDKDGETAAGPFHETDFCRMAKARPPEACPSDCGQPASGAATWRCPYHLTCGSVAVPGAGGKPLRLIVGRTLGSQDDLIACQDAVAVAPALGDEALAALAGVPWRSADQLLPLMEFLAATLALVAGVPGRPGPGPEKPKDLRQVRRNVSRG